MRIKVLGAAGGMDAGSRTTSFFVDNDTLIDAGTGVFDLPLHTQYGIQQIFITHAHFDHIVGLPMLLGNIYQHRCDNNLEPLKVYARDEVVDALQHNIFNNHIWPDYTQLPTACSPCLTLHRISVGQIIQLPNQRRVQAISAVHSVPALGYTVIDDTPCDQHPPVAWVFTGDTGRNPLLWRYLNDLQTHGVQLRWLVIEASYPNKDQAFADLTGHLTPQALADELQHLHKGGIDICLTHLKPGEKFAIHRDMQQLRRIAQSKNCTIHTIAQNHEFQTCNHAEEAALAL